MEHIKRDASLPTNERINSVKKWLSAAIKEWEPDFVGIENIQLQKFSPSASQAQVKTFQVLANLQGVLIDTLFEASIDHDLAYSSEWRKYCGINEGDQHRENKKKAAQEKVKLWYNQDCTQDEADAICIGKYFAHLLKNNKSTWGEDISIQLKDVIESTEVLKKLAGEKLRGKVAFQISKILKKLEDELTLFNSTRVEIIKKYSQTDENGELIADEEGNVKLKEESIEDFNKEIVELLNMEIKIDANKIAIEDIENIDFTPAEMTLLMPLIEE